MIAAVVVVAAAGITYAVSSGTSSSSASTVAVFARVQARTLQDTVTLTGTLSRKSIRNVDAANQALVSSVTSTAGDVTKAGQTLFSLGGRNAIAESGTFPFYRSLAPGDQGPDVLQLEKILAAAGDSPGTIDNTFTQQTQSALAQWQAQNGYPNSTPANPQAVTVSLVQGTGYQLGTQYAAPLTISPPVPHTAALRTGPGSAPATATQMAKTVQSRPSPAIAVIPALTITGGTTVNPGGTVTLTVSADQAPIQDTQVILSVGGSAQPGSDYAPVNPVVDLCSGCTTGSVVISTLATSVIQPDKYLVVSIQPSPGAYSVASPGAAVVTVAGSSARPTVTLTSATTYLQKGQPYAVSIGLSQAVSTPLTIQLSYGGTAVSGTDYNPPAGSIIVPAGMTSTQVPIPTVTSNTVESDRVLTVSVAPSGSYVTGNPSSASTTITTAAVPTLTIASNTPSVVQGAAATFTITASQAPVKNTTVSFAVQGTVQPGQGYVPISGAALLAAGQTQVTVVLQTIQTDITFQPTDMIVGQWPTRIGQVNVKAGQAVVPGQAILSLVEPDLSVTLQASAADRSKLQVGQTCTVQINGANNEGTGVITELDSDTTQVGTDQVYEGTIQLTGLTGADGSQVSITVVDQQIDNALTVPIAAVKQGGSGADLVRVVSLAKGGRITEVPVTTGLTEGSYIQITGGLRLGQLVIVQVTHP